MIGITYTYTPDARSTVPCFMRSNTYGIFYVHVWHHIKCSGADWRMNGQLGNAAGDVIIIYYYWIEFTEKRMRVWRSTLRPNITIKYETYYFMELRTTQTASFHVLCCTLFLNSIEAKKARTETKITRSWKIEFAIWAPFVFFSTISRCIAFERKNSCDRVENSQILGVRACTWTNGAPFHKCDSPKYAIILHDSYRRTDCLRIVDRALCTYIFHLSHSISKNVMLAEQEHRRVLNSKRFKVSRFQPWLYANADESEKVSKRTDEIRQSGCVPTVSLNIQC